MAKFLPKYSQIKVLVAFSILIIFLGLGTLWFGLKPVSHPLPSPTLLVETTPIATDSAVVGIEGERVMVTKVIDGDTIEIEGGIKVRLLGIDTPETKDPRRPVECFGKQAAAETKYLLEGKFVILEKDISETDKYGRHLRYIFLPIEGSQLLFINDYLIRQGFAKALTYPPDVKFTEQFRQAEREAKEANKGLWGRC